MKDLFCEKCGRRLDEDDIVCPLCQTAVPHQTEKQEPVFEQDISEPKTVYETTSQISVDAKSRMVAGFLQVFLGAFGIGRFYLGYNLIGALQIVVSFVSCGVGGIVWGFVDGLRLLTGQPQTDAKGNMLAD